MASKIVGRGAGSAFKAQIVASIEVFRLGNILSFTPMELAKHAGCGRSRCFTARCKELVEDGVLEQDKYWTERGGQAIFYRIADEQETELLEPPF